MTSPDRKPADPNAETATPDVAPVQPELDRGGSSPAAGGGVKLVPIRGVGERLVDRMTESLGVPTATSFRDIDAATLEHQRSRLNAALAPRRLSYTHLIAYAVAQAVAAHPEMAAFFREIEGRPHRAEPDRIGLGLAVDVEQRDGSRFLTVPVIAGAGDLTFLEFVEAYDRLVQRARTGRLTVDDLAGGTVTLTNPGTVGTTASVPRLMAGQGAIVATGAIRRVVGQALMTVSSTYDHRVIQGAQSGGFLRTFDELLQGADGFYEYVAGSYGLRGPVWGHPAPSDAAAAVAPSTVAPLALLTQPPAAVFADVAAATVLVRAFRNVGHRGARLDPLGSEPPGDPALDPASLGLTEEAMARVPASVLQVEMPGQTLADILPGLRRIYCGTIAFEVEHIGSHEERIWLRRAIESDHYLARPTPDQRRKLLARLTAVEALERFLQRVYLGQTRFSIEGLDVLVPMLDQLIELVASSGARTVEIGMPHRGRLNVMAHTVGVPYAEILAEFQHGRATTEGEVAPEGETSDVKYHMGADGVHETASGPVRVTISPNPSHLEAIDPVIEGRARAEQTDRRGPQPVRDARIAVPLLIHGDASFAAQGIVAETFNLARLSGYTTGGTIHLIGNNQLGFTVEPVDARSTDYASDLAKGFDVPIVHVNADDPEACLSAVRLAVAYRERFHGDFVIDVVGYRRRGHNEGDEPAYTQPLMYERIADHPTVRQLYLRRLAAEGVVEAASAEAEVAAAEARLGEIRNALEAKPSEPSSAGAAASPVPASRSGSRGSRAQASRSPKTAVAAAGLRAVNEQLLTVPPGFTIHPKLVGQLERRRVALESGGQILWAQAEALAFGSLLLEGVPIRLTGQDTERGTFSQRHLAFHDAANGKRYAPIENLPEARAPFEIHDSPLSEFACLGFEYGYAVEAPEALVVWEAQYGDFANGAEIIIDQFIIAGLAKWGQSSRLTMLLPHGYEGQGPEHSSARLERYLALGAEGNLRVANCSTPAQYFHLLRDQAHRETARPLVLMTPKGLLRLPAASSSLQALTTGRFQAVLDDVEHSDAADQVRRLVLCSGRIYYDLILSQRWTQSREVAVARVELLYPFPATELGELVRRYPNLESVVWAQEEPRNMGARKFVLPELREIIPSELPIIEVSRPERSSPAEGYPASHRADQGRIVDEAMGC
jgi:2-oxoglutarate decarboxylase